jgi:hypothetical protein
MYVGRKSLVLVCDSERIWWGFAENEVGVFGAKERQTHVLQEQRKLLGPSRYYIYYERYLKVKRSLLDVKRKEM